jgi:hypothetical protein
MSIKKYSFNLSDSNVRSIGNMHPGTIVNFNLLLPLFLQMKSKNSVVLANKEINYNYALGKLKKTKPLFSEYDKKYYKQYEKALKVTNPTKNTGQRYIIIPLTLHQNSTLYHANAILIDKETGIAELYEPNGAAFTHISEMAGPRIKDMIEQITKIKIKQILLPIETCPLFGLQAFNMTQNSAVKDSETTKKLKRFNKFHSIGGYCAAWSMYIVFLKITNPNKSIYRMQQKLLRRKKNIPYLIRGFYNEFNLFKLKLNKAKTPNEIKQVMENITVKQKPKSIKEPKSKVSKMYPEIPKQYEKNITKCENFPKNGGYNSKSLKEIAKSYAISPTKKKGEICTLLRKYLINIKTSKINIKPVHSPVEPTKGNYKKNITKCTMTETKGGYNIKELRKIGEKYGIKEIKRSEICKKLKMKLNKKTDKVDKYKKNMTKCTMSEAKGGYNIKELRKIAEKYGIKEKKRAIICKQLKSLS